MSNRVFIKKLQLLDVTTTKAFKKHIQAPAIRQLLNLLIPTPSTKAITSDQLIYAKIYGKNHRLNANKLNRLFSNANKSLEDFLAQQWQERQTVEQRLNYLKRLQELQQVVIAPENNAVYLHEVEKFDKELDKYFPIKSTVYFHAKKEITQLKLSQAIRNNIQAGSGQATRSTLLQTVNTCGNTIEQIRQLRLYCAWLNKATTYEQVNVNKLASNVFSSNNPPHQGANLLTNSLEFQAWRQLANFLEQFDNEGVSQALHKTIDDYFAQIARGNKRFYNKEYSDRDRREICQICSVLIGHYARQAQASVGELEVVFWEKINILYQKMLNHNAFTTGIYGYFESTSHFKNIINVCLNLSEIKQHSEPKQAIELVKLARIFFNNNKEKLPPSNQQSAFFLKYCEANILFHEKQYHASAQLLAILYQAGKETLGNGDVDNNLSYNILDCKLSYELEMDLDNKLNKLKSYIQHRKEKAIKRKLPLGRLEVYQNFYKTLHKLIRFRGTKTQVRSIVQEVEQLKIVQKYWLLNKWREML